MQCRCGLARTLLPVGFDPTSVYTKAYFDGSMADGYANYTQSAEQLRAEFAPLARELSERLPSSADASHNGGNGKPGLIEIGSAYGYFLDVARQYFDVAGVEVADDARLAAQQRGHRVYANVTELTTANNRRQPDAAGSPRAAAAVMLDVIEHLQDPRATLDAVAACLQPGATLVLTTGDWSSLIARVLRKHWRLLTPPQHLWFFTPASITALLAHAGFKVESIRHPSKRVPVALAAFQAARWFGPRAQTWVKRLPLQGSVPVNLFDAMRVVAVRQ